MKPDQVSLLQSASLTLGPLGNYQDASPESNWWKAPFSSAPPTWGQSSPPPSPSARLLPENRSGVSSPFLDVDLIRFQPDHVPSALFALPRLPLCSSSSVRLSRRLNFQLFQPDYILILSRLSFIFPQCSTIQDEQDQMDRCVHRKRARLIQLTPCVLHANITFTDSENMCEGRIIQHAGKCQIPQCTAAMTTITMKQTNCRKLFQ